MGGSKIYIAGKSLFFFVIITRDMLVKHVIAPQVTTDWYTHVILASATLIHFKAYITVQNSKRRATQAT